jgi:periplasmic divalent cation tolerance protein
MLTLYYITLNNTDEAQLISHDLLTHHLAVCTNWFPITCAYRWEDEIKQEAEVVLIVKSKDNKRNEIEETVKKHIPYTHCITEIKTAFTNMPFLVWLDQEVKD